MLIQGYRHHGGKHIETTVVANALAHVGVANPVTKAPLTEAAVLGIGGGITAGLSFCPSILRYGVGAGITVVSRYGCLHTDGGWHKGVFERLDVPYEVVESSSPRAAYNKLRAAVDAGTPAIVQCSKALPYYGVSKQVAGLMAWAWDVIVVGVDEDRGTAEVGDLADDLLTVPLDDLARARDQTCTHKNRMFTVSARKRKLTRTALKTAMLDGIRTGVRALQAPRIKTFSFDGVAKWAKAIGNTKAKSGWLKTFPKGKLFWALSDVFRSIETDGGGGLMRPLYAEFLDEVQAVTGKKAFGALADEYRALGAEWTELAEAALPGEVKPFKTAKQTMRKHVDVFRRKGIKASKQLEKPRKELMSYHKQMQTKSFALNAQATEALLMDLRGRINALLDAERAAVDKLAAVAG